MEFVSRALIAGSFCGGQVCYEAKAEENMAIHKQQLVSTSLVETVNATESQIKGERLVFNTGQIGDLAFISVFDLQPPHMHLKRACLAVEMDKGHWLQPEGLDDSPVFPVLQDKKDKRM